METDLQISAKIPMDAMDTTNRLNVLDVDFLSISMEEALALMQQVIAHGEKESVSFINADCLNISCRDSEYRSILQSQRLVFAVWLARGWWQI